MGAEPERRRLRRCSRLLFGRTPGEAAGPRPGAGAHRRRGAGRAHGAGRTRGALALETGDGRRRRRRSTARAPPGPLDVRRFTRTRRHRLAAHVVLRADPGRGAAGEHGGRGRAGGAGHGRRGQPGGRACRDRGADGPDQLDRPGSPRRWPTCRPARPSARWCTRCSSTPTRTPPTCAPSCARHVERAAALVAGRRRPRRRWPTRWCRCSTRRSGRWPTACTLADIGLRDRLRELDFEFPLAGGDRPGRDRPDVRSARVADAAAPAPAGRRPAAGVRRPAASRRRWAASCCAATSPARSTWCCGCRRRPRFLVVDYKTNWLGDPERAAHRARLHAGADDRGDAALATTRCRRCCTPSCCTASCAGGCPATTRRATSAACSTSTCAACAGPTPRWSTASRAGCSRGSRRRRWSSRCPTCWPGWSTA